MKKELEKELVEEYPDLYEWYDKNPNTIDGPVPPLTIYGFTIGDGWYNIVKSLSETLSRRSVECEVHQVKEKFGGLRFYHGGLKSDEERESYMAMGAINHAEEISFYICEECGASGEHRDNGYMRTLCDECYSEEKARRRDLSNK